MGKNLYIGNLAEAVTEEDLESNFAQAGKVVSASVIKDKYTGLGRGFGFVEMGTEEEAKEAIKRFDNGELLGKAIKVNEAKPGRITPRGGRASFEVAEVVRDAGPNRGAVGGFSLMPGFAQIHKKKGFGFRRIPFVLERGRVAKVSTRAKVAYEQMWQESALVAREGLNGEMERDHAIRVFGDIGCRSLYSIFHRRTGMVWDRVNRPILAHEPAYI